MQLIRRQETWDPFREMEALSNRINRLFGRSSGNGEQEQLAITDWSPSCDVVETDKEFKINAELPGVKKEDVRVTLEEGVLTIQGERREEKEEKGQRFHRRELSFGSFVRRFTMPPEADANKVDAAFKDGLLHVTIAKTAPKPSSAKQIAVH